MRLPLLLWPHLTLKELSRPLSQEETQTDEFKERLASMNETLTHFRGVGISAIQVNWPVRMFSMRTKDGIKTFINPVIVEWDGSPELMEEGCLSLPGIYEKVLRIPNVVIEVNDLDTWERKRFDLEGIEAQCAQHEIEHMDGMMKMMDGAGFTKRDIVKRKLKKQMKVNPLYNGSL
jgi:peptide deformylase